MSRFGLRSFVKKLEEGDERQQQAASQLRALEDRSGSIPEFLEYFNELRRILLLPDAAWYCLTTDLVEEAVISAVHEIINENEYHSDNSDLQSELYDELQQVINSFLKKNPMPMPYLCYAIDDLMEYVTREMSRDHVTANYNDQIIAKTAEMMPRTLRQFGRDNIADLIEQSPERFRELKEEGERFLIGMTYEEEQKESVKKHFGNLSN